MTARSKPTVRIEHDVNDALKAQAARPGETRSVTQLADHHLRHGLGLATTPAGDQPRARPARVSSPRARRTSGGPTPPGKCSHPIGRRIGDHCAACGAKV